MSLVKFLLGQAYYVSILHRNWPFNAVSYGSAMNMLQRDKHPHREVPKHNIFLSANFHLREVGTWDFGSPFSVQNMRLKADTRYARSQLSSLPPVLDALQLVQISPLLLYTIHCTQQQQVSNNVWAGIVDGRLMAIMFYGHEFAAAIALILLYESFNMCLFTWFRHDGAAHSSAASQNYHSPQIGHGYEAIFPGQHEHLT